MKHIVGRQKVGILRVKHAHNLPRFVSCSDLQCELKCSTVVNMLSHSSKGHLNLGDLS